MRMKYVIVLSSMFVLSGCLSTPPVVAWLPLNACDDSLGQQVLLHGDVKMEVVGKNQIAFFPGKTNDSVTFRAPICSNLTVAGWVKLEGVGHGDKPYPRIVETPGFYLHLTPPLQGSPYASLTFGTHVQGKVSMWSLGEAVSTGYWTHVAVTCQGGGTSAPTFFVNGQETAARFMAKPIPAQFRGGTGFFGNAMSGTRPFHGALADIRLYTTALAPSEIARLAQRTPEGKRAEVAKRSYRDELPIADISRWKHQQTVIAAGTRDLYQGHPTTLLMPDHRTIFAVWCMEHGGAAGPMARSDDAGRTWTRLDETLPLGFSKQRNCPSIYRIVDRAGKERLWVFTSSRGMDRLMSEDSGKTWREMPPLGFRCGMPFTGMIRLKDGRTAAFGQMGVEGKGQGVVIACTADGGLTWTQPRIIAKQNNKDLCEPFVLRSPDGQELCCLIRENFHTANSMMCFSRDEGETWTVPVDTAWGLTGDRHEGVCVPDGRWVIAFRDRAIGSSTYGQFVAWVGSYDDIRYARPGAFRIKLLHHYGSPKDGYGWAATDTGYPGMEVLPDGTIIATTYIKYWEDDRRHSVVCTRFTLDELKPLLTK